MNNLTRIFLQPAFILHRRLYRETSLLLDLFTEQYGRIALIARGGRKSRFSGLLQPFIPLLVSYQGRSELMNLTGCEAASYTASLRGDPLLAAFYLNELLVRLLQKHDPHPELYTIYTQTVLALQAPHLHEKVLRLFEKKLLEKIGYGLQLQHDFKTGKPFQDEHYYQYIPEQGFTRLDDRNTHRFQGKHLIALAKEELNDPSSLRDAKHIMRLALYPLLGDTPLQSRALFLPLT